MLDYFHVGMEIKTVDVQRRVISGYAAVHSTVDRGRDVIDPSASVKAMRRMQDPSKDVAVFIGHDVNKLSIGYPVKMEATPHGLYTETYVWKGPDGDNLLAVAKDMLDHGHQLGQSIGFHTVDSRHERNGTKMVRRLMDYRLHEYSFAAPQFIAHPDALVTSVKTRRQPGRERKALSEGSDTAGGYLTQGAQTTKRGRRKAGDAAMNYRVVEQGGKWLVICDADSDGDADDNQPVGSYNDEATANAVVLALRKRDDMYGDGDNDESDDAAVAEKMAPHDDGREVKAVWAAKYENDLPDSAFLFVGEGGKKDSDNRTVPRDLRHFPVRDAAGAVDLPHVRNAIARIPQSTAEGLDDARKAQLQARARRMLGGTKEGKTYVEPEEWQQGSPLALYGLGMRLLDLSETVASDLVAMRHLGDEVKAYQRIREPRRAEVLAVVEEIKKVVDWADTIDRGEDTAQRLAYYRRRAESLMAV